MAKIFNETRKVKGRTITKVVDFYGKRWALQDGADGYVAIDVQIPDYSNDIKSLLEGNSTVTSYPVSSNVTKLNNYSLYAFPNLTRVYLFYNGVVTISDNAFIGNASLEKIYVKSSQLATYQSTYAGKWFATLFDVIIEDYTITIEPSSEVTTLTREELDAQLGLLSSAEKSSATKVVFSSEWNKASVLNLLWYYAFVGFTNLNKNIWYGTEKVDFTQFAITGDGTTTLTNQAIATALTGNQYLTMIKDIKYSGFSDYSVALTYDYSALTSLEYVWTDNIRWQYDTQTQQWVATYFYPLSTFISQLGTHDNEVAYFDYNGTAPDMSAFTGWDYEWYDNASRTGNPVSMSAHKRYFLQLKPLNGSITILGSGTLTSGLTTAWIGQVKSSDLGSVNKAVVNDTLTTYEAGSLEPISSLSNLTTLETLGNVSITDVDLAYPTMDTAGKLANLIVHTDNLNYYNKQWNLKVDNLTLKAIIGSTAFDTLNLSGTFTINSWTFIDYDKKNIPIGRAFFGLARTKTIPTLIFDNSENAMKALLEESSNAGTTFLRGLTHLVSDKLTKSIRIGESYSDQRAVNVPVNDWIALLNVATDYSGSGDTYTLDIGSTIVANIQATPEGATAITNFANKGWTLQ